MASLRDIAVLVGSLRKDSFNRRIAHILADLAPDRLKLEIVEIGDLPHYNQDLDPDDAPAAWRSFRDRMRGADGVLFVTPEYNRSVPGALKNAIDVGSRPYGQSVFAKKPGAIASATPGPLGAFGANHHLRQSCVFLDIPLMQQPECYLANVGDWFDENGQVKSDRTVKFLTGFISAYADWVEKILRGPGELADDAAD